MNRDANFAGLPPIELPDGRKLETPADCAAFILELPKRGQEQPQWQQVTAALIQAAETWRAVPVYGAGAFSRALHGVSGVGPIPELPDDGAAWKAKHAKRSSKKMNPRRG